MRFAAPYRRDASWQESSCAASYGVDHEERAITCRAAFEKPPLKNRARVVDSMTSIYTCEAAHA